MVEGFRGMDAAALDGLMKEMGLAMSHDDLAFIQKYYQDEEKRDPTVTEIRVFDTYWSDHCRHTTFGTALSGVSVEKGRYTAPPACPSRKAAIRLPWKRRLLITALSARRSTGNTHPAP